MVALKLAASLAFFMLYAVNAMGHPDGADDEACKDMYPSHGYKSKSAMEGYEEGYRLVQEKSDYKPGDVITVKKESAGGLTYTAFAVTLSTEKSAIMGFLIKAFDENEKDVGSFRSTGPDSRAFSHCAGITHTSRDLKKNVVVQWLAPENKSGKVHFKVTVVKTIRDIYHAIPSKVA